MGCCSSSQSTTTTNKTAPLSGLGREEESILKGFVQSMVDQAGYDMTGQEKTEWADPDKANEYTTKISDLDEQISKVEADLQANPAQKKKTNYQGIYSEDPRETKLSQLQKNRNSFENKLSKIKKVTYTDWDVAKREDVRVLDAIDKYGEGSQQVTDIRSQIKQDEVDQAYLMADAQENYVKAINKVAKGDYSFTPEQAQQIDAFLGPMKDVLASSTERLLDEVSTTDSSMKSALDNLNSEIDKTGFKVEDALTAANLQAERSGASLIDVVRRVNENSEARARFQFDLMSEQADQKAAQQASMFGLPPGSMAEKTLAAKMKTQALQSIELDLNQRELEGELGIQAKVEDDKKQISLSRINLEMGQGSKREGAAQIGLGIAESTGKKREGILGDQAQALLGIEQARGNMLLSAASAQPLTAINAFQSGKAFENAITGSALGTAGALTSIPMSMYGIEQQRTFAESTQKSKTTSTPSIMDSILAGAGAIGSGFGSLSSMGAFGGGDKDGASGAAKKGISMCV